VGVYLVLVGALVHWVCTGPSGAQTQWIDVPTMHKACVLPSCAIVTFVMLIDNRDTKSPIYDSSIVGDRPALLCCFDAIVWGLFQALCCWSPSDLSPYGCVCGEYGRGAPSLSRMHAAIQGMESTL